MHWLQCEQAEKLARTVSLVFYDVTKPKSALARNLPHARGLDDAPPTQRQFQAAGSLHQSTPAGNTISIQNQDGVKIPAANR